MRIIQNYSSCNTLVDLSAPDKTFIDTQHADSADDQLVETRLLLPIIRDEFIDEESDNDSMCLFAGEEYNQNLYLPKNETGSFEIEVDKFLSGIPSVQESADTLFCGGLRHFSKEDQAEKRCLNILQGEVGHCTSSQTDIILSDDATTCHIVAIRSSLTSLSLSSGEFKEPLSSLTHIDHAGYDRCIREIFKKHRDYHYSPSQNLDQESRCERIQLELHVMGGFDDIEGSSREISEHLMSLFTILADEHHDVMDVRLQTCAISVMNDDGLRCPIGRGIGMDVSTGEVFLATIDPSIAGPEIRLRSARRWAGAEEEILSLVHDVDVVSSGGKYSITKPSYQGKEAEARLVINPFKFEPFDCIDDVIQLPDDVMLQHTSTSPFVEKDNFCENLRQTLTLIKKEDWRTYFGPGCNFPVVYIRKEGTLNEWELSKQF